jgi:hypothetical protein
LPWGTDALDLGSARSDREWDVTRVGRQPPEWDDDAVSITEANAVGIRFGGRPTMTGMSSLENLRYLMQIYGNSKYVLAFSNSVNRENYTHPTREYLTGRWVDALACGATVAGIAPGGRANVDLLWPGATLDLGSTARSVGLAKLTTAVKGWKAQHAVNNHFMALKKLDWRWRFQTIANTCGVVPPKLRQELLGLEHRLACDVGVTGSKGTAEDTKRD